MKKFRTTVFLSFLVGGIATAGFLYYRQHESQRNLLDKLLTVEKELSETRRNLLGYTKFTDYITETKKAIEGQMKFLATKVDREYVLVEHLQKSIFGLNSEATIIVKYAVEYSFGFDLKPQTFSVSEDQTGITITLNKPELVASPAVNMLSHEIPEKGVLIDEKTAVIALQQQLLAIAKKHANKVKNEEAVIALCEKRLGAFLRDFLAQQPGVRVAPAIKFAYK